MALQAMLDDGDEVLIPAPDYPLWTASTSLAGGRAVHYLCQEEAGWQPDLDDLRAKVSPRTKAIVVINPNNPTGAVYPREVLEGIAEIAREHDLAILSDEIYDKIIYTDAEFTPMAAVAPDLLTLTFNGLSKAYRLAGFRSGWLMVHGPRQASAGYIEGLEILANMRLCANVPAQHAIQVALGGRQSIHDLVLPGGRLREQRDAAVTALRAIPGVSCVEPAGALYVFPQLDPEALPDQGRPAVRAAVPARTARAAGAGHRLQLAEPRPPAHRHPAARRAADRGHRPARRLPRRLRRQRLAPSEPLASR